MDKKKVSFFPFGRLLQSEKNRVSGFPIPDTRFFSDYSNRPQLVLCCDCATCSNNHIYHTYVYNNNIIIINDVLNIILYIIYIICMMINAIVIIVDYNMINEIYSTSSQQVHLNKKNILASQLAISMATIHYTNSILATTQYQPRSRRIEAIRIQM